MELAPVTLAEKFTVDTKVLTFHVDAVSRLGWPSGIVQRVESGRDEPREDVHERVDEEIDAAQLHRVAKVDATATQRRLDLCDTGKGVV